MNLREPKKKYNVKLKAQPAFPIPISRENEWSVYTAHLTYTGACLLDPAEIHAVYSMGFFGKGSLSRSYPSFGKQRYGVPPIIRNRQWVHRREWLEQVKELSIESNPGRQINPTTDSNTNDETEEDVELVNGNGKATETVLQSSCEEIVMDDIEIRENTVTNRHLPESIDLVEEDVHTEVIDSSEEDDIRVILNESVEELDAKMKNNEDIYNFPQEEMSEPNSWSSESNMQSKVLVLPDSDSENDDYLKDIKPKVESESYPIEETLHLTHEETFFLLYGLGCLNLVNFDGTLLNIDNAWQYFCKTDKHFLQKYVVYHYFRSKAWIVKPGLKYGGDFLLYKQGPPFYHASYIVIIDVISAETLTSIPSKSMRNLTWNSLLGLERLSETAAKEILFAQVLWPTSVPLESVPSNPDVLAEFSVKEMLWRRWKPKNKNTGRNDEEEDSC